LGIGVQGDKWSTEGKDQGGDGRQAGEEHQKVFQFIAGTGLQFYLLQEAHIGKDKPFETLEIKEMDDNRDEQREEGEKEIRVHQTHEGRR